MVDSDGHQVHQRHHHHHDWEDLVAFWSTSGYSSSAFGMAGPGSSANHMGFNDSTTPTFGNTTTTPLAEALVQLRLLEMHPLHPPVDLVRQADLGHLLLPSQPP